MPSPEDTEEEARIDSPTWSSLAPVPGSHVLRLKVGNTYSHVTIEGPAAAILRFSKQLTSNLQQMAMTPLIPADEFS